MNDLAYAAARSAAVTVVASVLADNEVDYDTVSERTLELMVMSALAALASAAEVVAVHYVARGE